MNANNRNFLLAILLARIALAMTISSGLGQWIGEASSPAWPLETYPVYVPLVQKLPNINTIYGHVTDDGNPAANVSLELWRSSGITASPLITVTTNLSGDYTFQGMPALGPDQTYWVQYENGSNSDRQSAWYTHQLTSFPDGSMVNMGSFDIANVVVYFVSSNSHSLVNLLSGFAMQRQDELVRFLQRSDNVSLMNEWKDIQAGVVPSNPQNFLYYVFKKYQQSLDSDTLTLDQQNYEQALGIKRVPTTRSFDVEAQVIDLSRLNAAYWDPRLRCLKCAASLADSNAIILNVDYPLGLAAYDILAEVSSHVSSILGVYVMGKAAR